MEGGVDFDPLTPEGRADINEKIDGEYDYFITHENEPGESWTTRLGTKFGENYEYAAGRIRDLFRTRNPGQDIPVYMELRNIDELERGQDDAVTEIRNRYVNPDTSKFISRVDEFGQVKVKLPRGRSKEWVLGDPNIPKTLKNYLGDTIPERIENLENANEVDQNTINEQNPPVNEHEEAQERIDNRNDEIQQLDERLSLRERIKLIKKKMDSPSLQLLVVSAL